jgi:hypothetical protein
MQSQPKQSPILQLYLLRIGRLVTLLSLSLGAAVSFEQPNDASASGSKPGPTVTVKVVGFNDFMATCVPPVATVLVPVKRQFP